MLVTHETDVLERVLPLTRDLIGHGARIRVDGDWDNLAVSVPMTGAVKTSMVTGLAEIATRHGFEVRMDFAAQAARFIPAPAPAEPEL